MKQKLLHKLNNRRGFSFTEMLATVLIMGFVGIIITTGAATVQRVYRKVVAHANAQTALTTTITLMKDQLAFADPESIGDGSGTGAFSGVSQTISFQNLNSGEQTITLNPGTVSGTAATDPGTANRGFTLTYSATGTGTGTSSTSLPLLSDSAITSDLCVCFDGDDSGFSWDPATKVITVTKLVAKDTRTDTVQARASFKVLLVNGK
ncbi:MAG: hypothetical protein UF438_06350 [Oribacterium sp.]|nr:hypothetical protein [Oribacterium sp.]